MPGQEKCFKCGSVLENKTEVINVNPPRMLSWKRPFRFFPRFIRSFGFMPSIGKGIRIPRWMKLVSSIGIFGIVLSIIPGLSHVIQSRFKDIKWYVLAWFILMAAGIFLYGGFFGLCFFGLAIAAHTWIALDSSILKEVRGFGHIMLAYGLTALMMIMVYRGVNNLAIHMAVAPINMDIPYQNIEAGDYVLARTNMLEIEDISRGTIVLVRQHRRARYGGYGYGNAGPAHGRLAAMQIVGLPGETLDIEEGSFFINGNRLDDDQYPLPDWLQGMKMSVEIPNGSFFASSEYNVNRRGRGLESRDVNSVCVIPADQFEAKAFMRWLPVRRRGYIKEIE
jgi:hypothetical protein